jgi:hypothetical protein
MVGQTNGKNLHLLSLDAYQTYIFKYKTHQ